MCHVCCMCCRSVHVHECCTVGICMLSLFMLPRWTYSRSRRALLISHVNISQCSTASQYGVVLNSTHPKRHWILRLFFPGCMPLNCSFSNLNGGCHVSLFLVSWFWHWALSGFYTCHSMSSWQSWSNGIISKLWYLSAQSIEFPSISSVCSGRQAATEPYYLPLACSQQCSWLCEDQLSACPLQSSLHTDCTCQAR